MRRKIVGVDTLGVKDYSKSSGAFIFDTMNNGYVSPEYIRISSEDAWKFYRGNEWVNAVVNRIVDDCTKIALKVVPTKRSMQIKPRHEKAIEFIEDFLENPNPNGESFNEIREKFIRDMLVVGRGTQEKVFDGAGVLKEIYAIKSSSVDILTDDHGTIPDNMAYKQTTKSGKVIHFNKKEVIWTVFRHVSGSMYGEKPLDTLANAVASDILRATYNSNFFINGAEASGVLSLKGMSKTEMEKFKNMYKDNHRGVSKAHRMLAVNVPLEYVRMAITNRDMQFSEYGKELMMKIFAVFAMQPFVIGAIDGTTGKLNSSQQTQTYKDSALKPILAKEAHAYTKHILHDGFGMYDFKFEFHGIDLADAVTQSEIDRSDINAGILTINEVRMRRGLQPVLWGNAPISILPGGNQIDPDTGKLTPIENADDEDKDKDTVDEDDTSESDKAFKRDVSNEVVRLSKLFDVENIAPMLKSNINIQKYASDTKGLAIYEGLLKDVCEKCDSSETLDLKDVIYSIEENMKALR